MLWSKHVQHMLWSEHPVSSAKGSVLTCNFLYVYAFGTHFRDKPVQREADLNRSGNNHTNNQNNEPITISIAKRIFIQK